MSENPRAPRLPSSSEARPLWARALDSFYGPSFDVRSRKELAESMADFLELPPGEQAFHQAQLAFRQVQAMESIHKSLRRIEGLLGAIPVGALKHLGPMRQALEEIADVQADFLEAAEEEADGEDAEEEDEDLVEDDDLSPEADQAPASQPEVVQPEVLVPEIVEPAPAEAGPKKVRRPKVIDLPEAA